MSSLSAKTSINKYKVPQLFTNVDTWRDFSNNLDIGGGRYDTATEYLLEKYSIINYIYDPYNRPKEENDKLLKRKHYDTCTISNVLNVILNEQERLEVLQLAKDKARYYVYINVWEGNKSGIKSPTQMNEKLEFYLDEIKQVFYDWELSIKDKVITLKRKDK